MKFVIKSKLPLLLGSLLFLLICSRDVYPFANPFKRGSLPSKTFTYPVVYQELWDTVNELLKLELIPIRETNLQAGVITSEEFHIQGKEYREWAKTSRWTPSGFCTLFLKMNKKSEQLSQLVIAPDFQRARRSQVIKKGWHDRSCGIFETRLAGRVNGLLIQKYFPNLMNLVIGCDFYLNETTLKYYVAKVKESGLGIEQGLQNGDVVLKIDDVDVDVNNFFKILSQVKLTQKKRVTLDRGGGGFAAGDQSVLFFAGHAVFRLQSGF